MLHNRVTDGFDTKVKEKRGVKKLVLVVSVWAVKRKDTKGNSVVCDQRLEKEAFMKNLTFDTLNLSS